MTLSILRKKLIIQFIEDGILYGTEDHLVWKSIDDGKSWIKVCQIKPDCTSWSGLLKDKILRSYLVRTFRKNIGINNAVVLNSGTIVAQYDKIYRYEGEGCYASPVYDLEKEGVNLPLKNGLSYDRRTGNLYFGEYTINRPASIRIVRGTNDARNWDICYQFSLGEVRHVHGIFPDPYRNRIWVCTGDSDTESGLYYTDDDFKTLNLYGGGDQSWRMVSILITPDSLIWGTDAGQDAPASFKNYIYRLSLSTGERDKLCCIDKPAYYSTFLSDGSMCIATTFETKIRREVDPSAEVWWSRDGVRWLRLYSFPYEFSRRSYGTKYATILIPKNNGIPGDDLFCSLVNVKKLDFTAVQLKCSCRHGNI